MKKFLKLIILAILLISTTTFSAVSGQDFDTNAKIKAVFIYNFTKYIKWPKEYEERDFLIAILGENDPMVDELNNMSRSKKVGIRPFYIREFNKPINIGTPHIIYVSENMLENMDLIIKELKGKSTLIITDNKRTLDDSGINFIVVNNRQTFVINKDETKKRGLSISSILENLSTH